MIISDKTNELHEIIEQNGMKKFEGNWRAAQAINLKFVVLSKEEFDILVAGEAEEVEIVDAE